MIRYILLLVILLIGCPQISVAKVDTTQSCSIEQQLAKLFVAPIKSLNNNYKYSPGFVLHENQKGLSKIDTSSSQLQIIDLSNGSDDELLLPFPNSKVLESFHDKESLDLILRSALLFESLFGASGISYKIGNVTFLSLISNSHLTVNQYQVIEFPKDLKRSIPFRDFENNTVSAVTHEQTASFMSQKWKFLNWKGSTDLSLSFEELLEKGLLFYSENFEDDHQKLVRAYSEKLMQQELLIDALRQYQFENIKRNRKISEEEISKGKREQIKNRFEILKGSIALYEKKALVPLHRIDTLSGIFRDYRKIQDNNLYELAEFYHPDIKYESHPLDDTDIVISVCDSPDSLISLSEDIRIFNHRKTISHILLVQGVDESFFNSSLLNAFDAILIAEDSSELSSELLVQALYGGINVNGSNNNAKTLYSRGFKRATTSKSRLAFALPEVLEFNRDTLDLIDDIVNKAIKEKATPGAQLLIARKGNVIFKKSYGYHTYSKKVKVKNDDIYDIASVSKLCATFPIILDLYEQDLIKLDAKLGDYLADIDTTDKKDITIRELLLHQSGLISFLPFHTYAIDKDALNGKSLYNRRYTSSYNIKLDDWLYQSKYGRYRKDVFQKQQDSTFNIRVSRKLFMNKHFVDSMKSYAYASKLRLKKDYLYSDVGYHLLHLVMHSKLNSGLDEYFYTNFSKPLGANRVKYRPLNYFSAEEIVPTENDLAFRKELLRGYVHDQGAAMLGGVAANAGLFANASDLAKISQMFLNEGQYGGVRYFKDSTIKYFTSKTDSINRRGLGVDKPELNPKLSSPVSPLASPSSYGHSGFTGTIVWIDPEYDLIYIFLSNRIHPRAYNKKLIKSNVRTDIQDLIYRSILNH